MEGDLGWCRGGGSNNWDLHAVVRFACGGPGHQSSPPPSDDSLAWPLPMQQPQWHDDPAVDELFQALLAAPEPEADAPQPSSPKNEAPSETQQPKPRGSGRGGGGPTRSRRKSKKSQVSKEVTRVPAGSPSSSDPWAWRKYGQKPIKGSPYPRGYYRCSTDKDCKARKQVERCRADPATLIVTYTGDHSHPVPLHRNSLAGTTRNKPSSQQQQQAQQSPPPSGSSAADDDGTDSSKPQDSPASTACAGMSPATPLRSPSVVSAGVESDEDEEEDDDTLAVRLLLEDTDMAAEDDALMFLTKPDEASPILGSCDDVMLLPKSDEPAPADGSDVVLFPADNKPDELGPGPVSSGGGDGGIMLFPNPGEPQPTTTTVSSGTAPAMNFVEEKFSISGLSAWEAATSWGL